MKKWGDRFNYHLILRSDTPDVKALIKAATKGVKTNIEADVYDPRKGRHAAAYAVRAKRAKYDALGNEITADRWEHERVLFRPQHETTKYGRIGQFWPKNKASIWAEIKAVEKTINDGLSAPGVEEYAEYLRDLTGASSPSSGYAGKWRIGACQRVGNPPLKMWSELTPSGFQLSCGARVYGENCPETGTRFPRRGNERRVEANPRGFAVTADTLAEEIRTLETEFQRGLRKSIDLAADIGERLEAAKEMLPHGTYEPWLKKLKISKTTAHTYRAVARYRREGKFTTGATTVNQFVAAMKKARREEDVAEDSGEDVVEAGVRLADAATFDFGKVDIVATDPPWNKDTDAFRVVGKIGGDNLTDDGLVVCQCGNASVREAIEGVTSNGLRYLWLFTIVYPDARPQSRGGFCNQSVPVVVAGRKRPRKKLFVKDTFFSDGFEKQLHPWEQDAAPWRYWLAAFAQRSRIRVADPFSGSGTIGAVCKELGFAFTGTESNPRHYRTANNRIATACL